MSSVRILALSLSILVLPALAGAQVAGVAPDGRKGQLHVVVEGDTLWDITARYLGTPWIWPSIWKENGIENPHRIYPGDLIWITERGMRKVTPEEAAELMAQQEAPVEEPSVPAAPSSEPEPTPVPPDPFASLDEGETVAERVFTYPGLARFGWITPDQMAGSAAVLGSHEERYWISQLQRTIVSLGEGQVNIGDEFMVFRMRRRVLHPETGAIVGYFTQTLGKVEIEEIHPESSYVRVIDAYAEIEPGDRLVPYEPSPLKITEQPVAEHVRGTIVAQQPYRLYSGWNDFVILDRGATHGVQPGQRLTIYRPGKEVRDPLTNTKVLVPDDEIGRLFVVKVTSTTALALITHADRKIREGDRFRDI
ncbi:MAG: LysM peptidoglycan-binding domain-containing protein [Myxococcota bacterium]